MRKTIPKWSEMFPNGRHLFYEGNTPNHFVFECKTKFNFDPSACETWGVPMPMEDNPKFISYSFHCPAYCLDDIYSGFYPIGS